jgi:hypothetical protein
VERERWLGLIVHVHIGGVAVKNPHDPSGVAEEITHLPFAVKAIDKSVTEMTGTVPVPDYQEGYDIWRAALDKGEAGIFSDTVAEAVGSMEQTLNNTEG